MAKDMVSAYRKVCLDLKVLQAYEGVARKRLEAAHLVVFKGKMPSSAPCYVPLTTALDNYNLAVDEYNETTQTIDELIGVKVQMERVIANMTEAERLIVIMHVEQGKNLREIAEISHYSYGHLKNVSRRLKNEVTESANAS